MNKKGFTLVELLAVIVILGMLLIIAVPKINNVIDNAQKGAYKSTNAMIVSELNRQNGLGITPQVYTFTNGVMSPDLGITGELPKSGTIEINSLGQIQVVTSNDKYCAIKRFAEDEIAIFNAGNRLCNVVQEVSLTVNPNGGTYAGSTSNTVYQILPEATQDISNPTRDGYIFTGWSLTCTACLVNNVYTMSEEEDTLTANWLSYDNMFTYTGSKTVIDDGNGNFRIKFLTSGTFTPLISMSIDVFLVGGGGGGAGNGWGVAWSGGGGGGYTKTYTRVNLTANQTYTITIGGGGGGSAKAGTGGTGGTTSAFTYSATGGTGGTNTTSSGGPGGNGGSGGGNATSTGGSNGSNAPGDPYFGTLGVGQGTTTREFGEPTGDLYAGGGAGGYSANPGGAGGGGATGVAGTPNTGGGGGSSQYTGPDSVGLPGGSGIVIIRNTKIISVGNTVKYNFSYSGSYLVFDQNTDNWRIKFLTSGTLTSLTTGNIDAFLVGGGGGGAGNGWGVAWSGGGGGGYTTTRNDINLTQNQTYAITIGAGGNGSVKAATGSTGGTTSAFTYTAAGGFGGTNTTNDGGSGGNGGSGGGNSLTSGASDGATATGDPEFGFPGVGQGTTTREFGEPTGALYAGGGGGGYTSTSGGAGGGGGTGVPGTPNTGGGGGSSPYTGPDTIGLPGGTGIVIIRAS